MLFLHFIPIAMQVHIFLPRLLSGSGSEMVFTADVPNGAVAVDKVIVNVEIGCATE